MKEKMERLGMDIEMVDLEGIKEEGVFDGVGNVLGWGGDEVGGKMVSVGFTEGEGGF